MIGNGTGFAPYEQRTSMIKVISYEQRNIRGFLINPFFEKDMYFENLTQLLFLIEGMLDERNFPQRSMESRNFQKLGDQKPIVTTQPPTEMTVLATFKISVLFRQNASWQGSIAWMDCAMESQFRSVLELVTLMDSVLCTNSAVL